MRKFTEIPDSPAVADIIERLRDAGIEAEVSRGENVLTIYGGGFPAVAIWVSDDADDAFVKQVIDDCNRRQHSDFCPNCGYDLSGHGGEALCPECGSAVYASEGEVVCEACGEENPGSFETCWNCDEPLTDAPARAAAGGTSRRPLPPGVEEVAPDPETVARVKAEHERSRSNRRVRMIIGIVLAILAIVFYLKVSGSSIGSRIPLPW